MGKIIIKNIKELVQVLDAEVRVLKGEQMSKLSTLKDAWLAIENDLILAYGKMEEFPEITDWNELEVIDATGKMVFPSWCDSHTHIVFAKSREEEFVDRINGLTYQEIAAKGGGILNSAKKLQFASEDELYEGALKRINEIKQTGTGAVEIKSGYGLTADAELKMLRVIKRLKENCDITIKANFLGAHALPVEFKENRRGYIDLIINEMLPKIKEEGLADFIDVFCETNYYTPEEADEIINAGKEIGLIPKFHTNQFTSIGGIQVGVKNQALSVDHLEVMTEQDIDDLAKSEVMPTLLPSCSFFLSIPYAPAKQLIEKGLPICLATDFNPGSTPSGNMNFVLSLACINMKLTPEQAINATTINAAYAMGLEKTHGSISVGKKANIFITNEINSYAFLPYYFGHNQIEEIIIEGKRQ
ncbi:MAG: imidazolonepropionase [Flavobacteriales bacterium]|nr:imidazolonepropionase [Flavobacteriales bacterium]